MVQIGAIVQNESGGVCIQYDRTQVPQKSMAQLLLGLANAIIADLEEREVPRMQVPPKLGIVGPTEIIR